MGFTHIWVKFTNYELVLEMFETHFTIRILFFPEKKKKSLVCTGKQFKKNKLASFPTGQFTPHACRVSKSCPYCTYSECRTERRWKNPLARCLGGSRKKTKKEKKYFFTEMCTGTHTSKSHEKSCTLYILCSLIYKNRTVSSAAGTPKIVWMMTDKNVKSYEYRRDIPFREPAAAGRTTDQNRCLSF